MVMIALNIVENWTRVTPDPDIHNSQREDLNILASELTNNVEIRFEHEAY